MKTCEEYVLQELEAAKEKILKLKKDNEELLSVHKLLFDFLAVLKKYMFVAEGAGSRRYIEMKYVFEEFEEKDFEMIEAVLLALEDV